MDIIVGAVAAILLIGGSSLYLWYLEYKAKNNGKGKRK